MRLSATAMRAPTLTATELRSELPQVSAVGPLPTLTAPAANVPHAPVELGEVATPVAVTLAPWSIAVFVLASA